MIALARTLDPHGASDLRRTRSRDLAEILTPRAAYLLPDDRAIIESIYRDGLTAARVAQLRDVSPHRLRRRVRTTVQRMLSPTFEFVLTRRGQWTRTRRVVATACILEGRTLRDAAQHNRLSLYTVRRHLEAIRTLAESGDA